MKDDSQFITGDNIGPYQIIRKIGSGGMGEIYEAWEDSLKRKVAIKVIAPQALENESILERFKAEGRALSKLSNPHIVSVYALGSVDDRPYIAMEFIEGMPLNSFLVRYPCGIRDLVGIFRQIAIGLNAAHQAGIVHRDLKPANIIIDGSFHVKLIDFGIAKVYSEQASFQTSANVFIGTLNYSAPEVLKGKPANAKADIFSLGLVFYFMMTGETPFDGKNQLEVIESVRAKELLFAKQVGLYFPLELRNLVKKMTAKNPDLRYDTVEDVLTALSKVKLEDVPHELNVSVSPQQGIKNRKEIKKQLIEDGFNEVETRFILSLAVSIEATNEMTQSIDLEDTSSTSSQRTIAITKEGKDEAIKQFRRVRSRLITKQIATEKNAKNKKESVWTWIEKNKKQIIFFSSLSVTILIASLFYFLLSPKAALLHPVNVLQDPPEIRSGAVEALKEIPQSSENKTLLPIAISKELTPTDTPSAPVPNFKIGQTHTLRIHRPMLDGALEHREETIKIVKVESDRYVSESSLKRSTEQSSNIFLPPYQMTEIKSDGSLMSEKNDISGDPLSFFPLKIGKKSNYKIQGTREFSSQEKAFNEGYEYSYTCEVTGQEVIKAEWGSRLTFKVICDAKGSLSYHSIFNYDSEIGRVILWRLDDAGKSFEELISYKF